jgi:exonuclease VII small subunit
MEYKSEAEVEILNLERSIEILEEGLEYLHRKLYLLKKANKCECQNSKV